MHLIACGQIRRSIADARQASLRIAEHVRRRDEFGAERLEPRAHHGVVGRVRAGNDCRLPCHLSSGPKQAAICRRKGGQKPAVGSAESTVESRFSKPPESAFGALEKG
jgi:hypothetical protein